MSRGPSRAAGAAIVVLALVVGGIAAWAVARPSSPSSPAATVRDVPATAAPSFTPPPERSPTPTPTPTPTFDLAAHSTTDPASPWVVVNKHHPLDPVDHVPDDLVTVPGGERVRSAVADDLRDMIDAAAQDGVTLTMQSGYRSYAYQQQIFGNMLGVYGREDAERLSARPGYSEHQTGLAVDLGGASKPACDFDACFASIPEGRWIAAHVGEHGFLVRYTKANQEVTGYAPEAWHLRWVGRPLTARMAELGVTTLEEIFDVDGGSDYR